MSTFKQAKCHLCKRLESLLRTLRKRIFSVENSYKEWFYKWDNQWQMKIIRFIFQTIKVSKTNNPNSWRQKQLPMYSRNLDENRRLLKGAALLTKMLRIVMTVKIWSEFTNEGKTEASPMEWLYLQKPISKILFKQVAPTNYCDIISKNLVSTARILWSHDLSHNFLWSQTYDGLTTFLISGLLLINLFSVKITTLSDE